MWIVHHAIDLAMFHNPWAGIPAGVFLALWIAFMVRYDRRANAEGRRRWTGDRSPEGQAEGVAHMLMMFLSIIPFGLLLGLLWIATDWR